MKTMEIIKPLLDNIFYTNTGKRTKLLKRIITILHQTIFVLLFLLNKKYYLTAEIGNNSLFNQIIFHRYHLHMFHVYKINTGT